MADDLELCGWVEPDRADVEAGLKSQPGDGDLATAAPHLYGSWDKVSNIKLWDACIKVTGQNLPADKQGIGDCVSHGHARGVDYVQCIQIALGNLPYEYVEGETSAYSEAMYGDMRRLSNGLGNQDGSSGIAAVRSLTQDGFVMRKGRTYSAQRAKDYGRTGTPESIMAEARGFELKQYIQPRTADEGTDLLANGYPITVCSSIGFSKQRNADAICERGPRWDHCMLCIGMILIRGSRKFAILQSWGADDPSGPLIENMPTNSFLIHEQVFQAMLAHGDSYALVSIPGAPSQNIDFRT